MCAMAEPFAALRDDFIRITNEVIWCSLTTVDEHGRPRARIMHPIWEVLGDRPVGWMVTGRTPVKSRHLAGNPNVAVSYWSPAQQVVLAEGVASWVEDAAMKQHVWDLFMTTPPPRGYDLGGFGIDGVTSEIFTPLRLDPHSVHVFDGTGFPADFTPRTARF
jgi:uncharacterized pyridoxamine 5'-phosphate oxidase family protein